MPRLEAIAGLCLMALALFGTNVLAAPRCPEGDQPFASFYRDGAPFTRAMARVARYPPAPVPLTGITVPHHLLVGHLTALGFRAASSSRPQRIVVIAPDHFRRAATPFAVATRGFETPFGLVPAARDEAEALLAASPLVEESCLFVDEHGVQAMMPFIRETFPDVPVLAIAVALRSNLDDWNALARLLEPLMGEGTLVVQSTDFSHYLPQAEARRFDQQTLNLLAAGPPEALAALRQPQHADTVGGMVVQATLQARLGSLPAVIANENSQGYAARFVAETTSYCVILWGAAPGTSPPWEGASRVYLGGDAFFGRAMQEALRDEGAAARVEAVVRRATVGAPLVLNLEGVILPDVPKGLPPLTLAMPADLALPWLKRLNVVGVSLANNHALDLGASGVGETRAALRGVGIQAASQGEAIVLPGLDIVALSDLGPNGSRDERHVSPAVLDTLAREGPDRAVAALIHWGREWEASPGSRETELATAIGQRAVAVIAGAHPHRASEGLAAIGGGDTVMSYSLGNFLFDQGAERGASGALLELTVFPQGTMFARRVGLPNLFDLARK